MPTTKGHFMPSFTLEEIDEVWLALEQSWGAFFRDGHRPSEDPTACQSCYAMYLVRRAQDAYTKRVNDGSITA